MKLLLENRYYSYIFYRIFSPQMNIYNTKTKTRKGENSAS